MNAAARFVLPAQKYEHVTPLLRDLHWLWVPERIEFKLSQLVFCCLHGTAPAYLMDKLCRVTDSKSRRRLRSASMCALLVPPTHRTTISERAFPVAGACVWNVLPSFVTDSATVTTFKHHLETYLFTRFLSSLDITVSVPSLCYDCVLEAHCRLLQQYNNICAMIMMMVNNLRLLYATDMCKSNRTSEETYTEITGHNALPKNLPAKIWITTHKVGNLRLIRIKNSETQTQTDRHTYTVFHKKRPPT